LLETAPLFYLQASRMRVPLDDVLWRTMDTLDFAGLPLPRPADQRPFHFQSSSTRTTSRVVHT